MKQNIFLNMLLGLIMIVSTSHWAQARKYTASTVNQYQGPLDADDVDQKVIRVALVVTSGPGTPTCSEMRFDVTNWGDVAEAKLVTTGQTATYTSPTALDSVTTWASNIATFSFTAVDNSTATGSWYYWLVITMNSSITTGVQVDASYKDGTFATTPTFAAPDPAGFRMAGRVYDIGADYATLGGVATAMTSFDYDDNDSIFFEFSASYGDPAEDYTISFGDGGGAVIVFRPASGQTIVTAGDPGASANFIELTSASNYVFDGRAGGTGSTRSWTIKNSRGGASGDVWATFELSEGSSNNVFKYLNIEGEQTADAANVNRGMFSLATDGTASGNDDNIFSYCHFRDIQVAMASDATYLPCHGIVSTGTSGRENSGTIIDNCHFYDIYCKDESADGRGASIRMQSFCDAWTVTNCHFYQTVASYSGGFAQGWHMISLNSVGSGGHTVKYNFIGGQAASCGGSPYTLNYSKVFFPIFVRSESTTASVVRGNTISNMSITTDYTVTGYVLTGISLRGNYDFVCDSNVIGTSAGDIAVINNSAATTQGFRGISNTISAGIVDINNNSIGGVISSGSSNVGGSVGIESTATGSATLTITHNHVGNNEIEVQSQTNLTGINAGGSAAVTSKANRNLIENLSNSAGAGSNTINGMLIDGSATTWNIFNNIVLLDNAANTDDVPIYGINDNTASTNNIIHNVAKIFGTGTGSSQTASFYRQSAGVDSVKNNLWQNIRSGGTGGNYAAIAAVTTGTYNGDYNYIEVTENTSKTGNWGGTDKDVAGWQAVQPGGAGEAASITGSTTINAIGGAGASFVGQSAGYNLTATVAEDRLGVARTAPVWIGGYEGAGDPLPIEISVFSAKCLNSEIELNWTTNLEINNDFFSIERSVDGENFERIGSVYGGGNSSEELKYKYIDENPCNGLGYYRLKQTDFDGQYKYLNTISHECPSNTPIQNWSISPNPVNQHDHFTISTKGFQSDVPYNVSVTGIKGDLILIKWGLFGNQNITLPHHIKKGVYTVGIISNNQRSYKKLVVR